MAGITMFPKKKTRGVTVLARSRRRPHFATTDYVSAMVARGRETKLKYIENTSEVISTTELMLNPVVPSQGTAYNQRLGDIIFLRKVVFRGFMYPNAAADGTQVVRMIVFQWKDDTTPTASDILLSTGSTTAILNSPYAIDTRDKFKILRDKRFILNPRFDTQATPVELAQPGGRLINMTFSKKRLINKVQYDAAATTGRNKLFVYIVGSQATGASKDISFAYNIAVYYKDA